MTKALTWLKARLSERSTLAGITLAISAAAALPYPWSITSFIVGTIAAFIPDGNL